MEATRYISELLEQHDCVIIPGLGGFIGSYHPAAIHPLYHTFQPPYKKLLFNINLRHNDGLLSDHIARKEQITFAEANEMVRKFAEECLLKLKQNRQVLIRDVGRLFMGQEGTIQFDQDLRHNLLAESYGLQPFFSVPVKKAAAKETVAAAEKAAVTRRMTKRALYRPLKWAAILALPVGIAIMLSITGYDHIRTTGMTYADVLSSISVRLSPFSSAEKKAEPTPVKKSLPQLPAVSANKPQAISQPATSAVQSENTVIAASEFPYAVIVGAFRIEENATNLIARLRGEGLPALLYDVTPGGLHRVASGTFSGRAEALAALHSIRLQGFEGAWLLVK
jgi:cell division septation protein DedD